MRYFKKFDPRVKVWTGAGFPVPFEAPFENAEWGLLATTDNYVIGQLEACIKRQACGVAEITAADFENLKKKTFQRPLHTSREWVDRKRLVRSLEKLQDDVAAAAKRIKPEIMRNFSERRALAGPRGVSTFRPKAVARA